MFESHVLLAFFPPSLSKIMIFKDHVNFMKFSLSGNAPSVETHPWLLQPYGVVTQKARTFLRFQPASLQSVIQMLRLLAKEAVSQFWSSQ